MAARVANVPPHEWERTFDAVPDLIAIIDKDHRIVRVNKPMAEKLGRAPEELVGRTCHEMVHGMGAPPSFCLQRLMLEDGQEHSTEVFECRMRGDYLVSVSPLRDADGTLSGSVHVARDISDRKRAEEKIQLAVEQRDRFLAILSHELRNPLGAILNAVHVVRAQQPDDSADNAVSAIERQARQMASLLDDLLDVSRIVHRKIKLRREVVNVAQIIAEAVNVVQPLTDNQGQELVVDVDGQTLPVNADPTRLQQILVNLLNNASKYTPRNGRIELRAMRDGVEAVFRVRDSGQGIPADMLDEIFDLFVQTDRTLDRNDGGMGVGLTLVRMLVELHGGSVTAHSDGIGLGSEFVVRLPLVRRMKVIEIRHRRLKITTCLN